MCVEQPMRSEDEMEDGFDWLFDEVRWRKERRRRERRRGMTGEG